MRQKLGILLAVLVVLLIAAPVVLAQGFDGDKVVFNEDFILRSGETLDGNLVVLGGNAALEDGSLVRGDVTVAAGSLDAAGEIDGNLGVFGGRAALLGTAVVEGDFTAFGGSVSEADGAVIRGERFTGLGEGIRSPFANENSSPADDGPVQRTRGWLERFVFWQLGTFGLAVLGSLLGILLVLLAPRAMERLATTISTQTALSFGVGFLTLALAVLAGALLLIACGLGLLVWLALLAGWLLGWIAVALWLGQALLRALKVRTVSSLAEVVLGVFLITFVSRVPWCGFLFSLAFGSIGLGAVVLTRFGTRNAEGTILSGQRELVTHRPVAPGVTFDEMMAAERPASTTPAALGLPEPSVPDLPLVPEPAALTAIEGIDAALAERLAAGGILTVADLAKADVVRLAELTGVTVGQLLMEDWIGQAQRTA